MEELDPGTSIYLQITLDEDTDITAEAVLIHTETVEDGMFEAGFAFTAFNGSSRQHLETFLDHLE